MSGRHCDEEIRTRQLELEEEAGVPDVKGRVGGRGRGKKGEKGEFDVSNGDVGSRHRLDWTEAGMFFVSFYEHIPACPALAPPRVGTFV